MNRPATAAGSTDPLDAFGRGRRLEDWIVSNIDEPGRARGDGDWLASLERFSLARQRPGLPRTATTSADVKTDANSSGWARFRLSGRRGVTVATLTDQALIREDDLAELAGDLIALTEAGHRRLALDFQGVERLSTWAAASIAGAVARCAGGGASFKICGLKPGVASMFAVAGVAGKLGAEVATDVAAAVAGPWPEQPEFRPLPVSILAALMQGGDSRPARDRIRKDSPSSEDLAMKSVRLVSGDGRSIPVKGGRFVIGRGSSCQLRLLSASVSRSHAAIERREGRLILRDLASTNGLKLNGQVLRAGEAEVRHGDRIEVGPISFLLEVGPEEETDRAPARRTVALRRLAAPRVEVEAHADSSRGTEETLTIDGFDDDGIPLRCEVIEGTLVVTPMVERLDGDATIDALRDALIDLFDRDLPRRVVISLAHVGQLSSRAIGVLVAHHLKLDHAGGALRVCLACPRVALVLDQVHLAMLVDCHQDVDEAVIAAWPG